MKKYLYSILLAALLLSACGQTSSSSESASQTNSSESATTTAASSAKVTNVSNETSELAGDYEAEDLTATYDEATATKIKLSSKTTIDGEGASVSGGTVTITKAGTYLISGELNNGQLKIKAGKEDKVRLILNGVTLTNTTGPAIYVEQAEKVTTTLVKDTTNTISDGTNYQLATGESEPDAAIFSKEDLVFNGEGTLKVSGNYSNGIRSKDDLILISGTYQVSAKNNALKGKDSVMIRDGNYDLTTEEGDGIQANNSEDTTKGYVILDGGSLTINSGRDGIQAETDLSLQNAKVTIKTATGATSSDLNSEESYKGLKVGQKIMINSGDVTVDSADDSLHSNGTIEINGGQLDLQSGDDGIHADDTLTINSGTTKITKSYEGLEASVINLKGGNTSVVASDDGVNAGGGSDTETSTGGFGQDSFGGGGPGGGDQADDSKQINIIGGTLYVDAQGDGLDSNGNVTMSGGEVSVDGPTDGGNGALDYNGTFKLTGGTLISAGSNGMAMNVSDSSTQASIGIYFDQNMTAGTKISLKDSSGQEVISYTPSKAFQYLQLSSADLKKGATYTLESGGQTLGELTISETVVNLTQAGETANTQQGRGPR